MCISNLHVFTVVKACCLYSLIHHARLHSHTIGSDVERPYSVHMTSAGFWPWLLNVAWCQKKTHISPLFIISKNIHNERERASERAREMLIYGMIFHACRCLLEQSVISQCAALPSRQLRHNAKTRLSHAPPGSDTWVNLCLGRRRRGAWEPLQKGQWESCVFFASASPCQSN